MKAAALFRPSLARRLVVLAAAWSVAVLIASGLVQTALFHQATLMRFDDDLHDDVLSLYSAAHVRDDGTVDAPTMTDPAAMRAYSGTYWEVAAPAPDRLRVLVPSRSLFDSELTGPPGGVAQLEASPGKVVYYDTTGPAHEPLRVAAMLGRLPRLSQPAVFMAAEDLTPVNASAKTFALETVISLIVLGVGLVLVVLVQVRVGLAPIFALRNEVTKVRTGEATRLAGDYPSELAPLAEELNALVAHDEEMVERQRTHLGNLAHALKTPLSVMLAEAGLHPGALAEVVSRQADAMRGHVDHHLRRARAAARSQSTRERTPVAPVLEELAHALERIFHDRGVQIDWRCPDDLYFLGERQDLLELLGNVLENASKYTNRRVFCRAELAAPGRLSVMVEDDGPGLPQEQRAGVFKRGARLDETAPGSGLGLSIVDELARAYGGQVTLSDSSFGGLKVVLDLPGAAR